MTYRHFIERVLQSASAIAREQLGRVAARVKEDDPNQVLTNADTAIGELMVSSVQQEFSDHNVIDEETGTIDRRSRYTWVIDPIDGTSNFATGLPQHGVMLGLLEDSTPIAGGISLPAFREIYIAEKGRGATCNGSEIHVASGDAIANRMLCYGIDVDPSRPEFTRNELALLARILLAGRYKLRGSNSAYDIAMVASGRYGAFLNKTSKIWDNVAPQILIEEAGGRWTTFDGMPIDYSDPLQRAGQNFTHCGASAEAFRRIQEIIRAPQSA